MPSALKKQKNKHPAYTSIEIPHHQGRFFLCLGIALALHLFAAGGVHYYVIKPADKEKVIVKMKVVEKKKPKPKPKILEKVKKEFVKKKEPKKVVDLSKLKKKKKKKKVVAKKKVKKKVKKVKKLPPPPPIAKVAPPAKKPAEPPKPVFGINKNSIVKGSGGSGGFKVRVGNTIMKEMELEYTDPKKVKPYTPAPLYEITRLPKLLEVVKPEYSKEARDKEIEGVVVLEVDIDEDGDVRYVKVLKKLGYGLDKAALKAVAQFKYRPAMQGKVAVSVKKKVKIRFMLDE